MSVHPIPQGISGQGKANGLGGHDKGRGYGLERGHKLGDDNHFLAAFHVLAAEKRESVAASPKAFDLAKAGNEHVHDGRGFDHTDGLAIDHGKSPLQSGEGAPGRYDGAMPSIRFSTERLGRGYEPVNGAAEMHPIDLAARAAVEGQAAA